MTANSKVYDGLEPVKQYLDRNGQGMTKQQPASPPKRKQSFEVQRLKRELGLE